MQAQSPWPASPELPSPEALAERVWSHTTAVYRCCPNHAWRGLHQVTRIVLELAGELLFPEGMKTRRSSKTLEILFVALAGLNQLGYLLVNPQSERARTLLLLLRPPLLLLLRTLPNLSGPPMPSRASLV